MAAPDDPSPAETSRFSGLFARWARGVRLRLATRVVLTGLGLGLTAAAAAATVFWWQRLGAYRPWTASVGLLGVAVAAFVALRRRWSDGDVALYLDAKLDAKEAISTAVSLDSGSTPAATRHAVLRDAARALGSADPKLARPRVLRALHGLVPLGGAAVAYVCMIPLPPAPPAPAGPPGADKIQLANLEGLEKIERLETLDARDAEQRERLKKMAEEARRLREDLAKGMEKREAQAKIAKLRDDVAAERLKLGDEKNRAGLEAAVGKLADNPLTKDAAKALGDGDLVEFDRKMAELANRAEKEDREAAKKALEEAAKAAREKGSQKTADALDEQRRAFEQREAKGEALRQLAEGLKGKLSEQAQKDLEEFGESGSPEAQKRLADAMNEALEGMSEEERKQLAERLQKQMEGQQGANPMTKQQIEELAKKLATPQGKKELAERLKELGKPDPSGDAKREQGLDDAERGGAEAERGLGGACPMPSEGPGQNDGKGGPGDKQGKSGANKGNPSKGADGKGGPGSKKDEGQGDHKGSTSKLDAKELRSKANAKLDKGVPMHGSSLGRAPSRPGETANQAGTGALGQAGPAELGGVEGSEVPEEYREQVGRYFQP